MESPQQTVFILCHARTGSSLLRYVIDTHERAWSPPEVHVSRLMREMFDVCAAYSSPLLVVGNAESGAARMAREERVCAEVRERIQNLVRTHMPEGKTLWCQKSVMTIQDVALVRQVFPDAKYLCLYRNCLDFVNSAMERCRSGWRSYGFEDYLLREVVAEKHLSRFPDALARFWCDQVEMILKFQGENQDRCHSVQYEHLVLDPFDTCNRLFGFMGLEPFEREPETNFWNVVFGRGLHQRTEKGGDFKADKSKTVDKSRIGTERNLEIAEETWTRVRKLQDKLGYSMSRLSRFYAGGFENVGKGTPSGDGKDKAMRMVASRAIVELAHDHASSSRTTRDSLGTYDGEHDVTVMLARNGELRGAQLRDESVTKVREARDNGCVFVVGDMPGVDTGFITLLDEIHATYTIYYCSDYCRVKADLEKECARNV